MQSSNLPLRERSMAQGETSMRKHKLLIAVIMFGLTWAGIVKAEDQPIEQQLVDAMNKVFGAHPGFRANHAKGIVVEGNFKASAEAAGLSRAVLFNGSPIQRRCDSPIRPEYQTSRTGPITPIRTAWLSSFICRAAAIPTW